MSALDDTLGALLIGVLLSFALSGILFVQICAYYQRFRDSKSLRAVVFAVWALDLGHTICGSITIYDVAVSHYGSPSAIARLPNVFNATILLTACTAALVQIYYARRIHLLTHLKVLPAACMLASTFILGAAIADTLSAVHARSPRTYFATSRGLVIASYIGSAVTDLTIAGTLCWYLWMHRREATNGTVRLVDKVMLWTVQTGLLTSMSAIIAAVCALSMQSNYIWIAVFSGLAGLYGNSLLAILNARAYFRDAAGGTAIGILNIPAMSFCETPSGQAAV